MSDLEAIDGWRAWLQRVTDRLLDIDERAEANATTAEQRSIAMLYLARRALGQRVDALAAAPEASRAALSSAEVADEDGTVIGSDLAAAAAEVDRSLVALETRLDDAERQTLATAEQAAVAAADLNVAERLAAELSSEVNVVNELRARVNRGDRLADVGQRAKEVRQRLEAVDADRRDALESMAGIHDRLGLLSRREAAVRELAERCRDKIADAPRLAVPSVAALGEPPSVDGPWPSRRAEVVGYVERVERLGAALDHAERRFSEPLARRDDLRGLVQSFREKAASAGIAESPVLDPLYRRAADLLWQSPCDVAAAEREVRAYITAVNGTAGEADRR